MDDKKIEIMLVLDTRTEWYAEKIPILLLFIARRKKVVHKTRFLYLKRKKKKKDMKSRIVF